MIFLSHSEADKQAARRFALDLSRKGEHVWLDEGNIRAGDNLDREILTAIERSTVLLFLASRDSLASGWVQKEIEHATRHGIAVVPVLLGSTTLEDLPAGLAQSATIYMSKGRHAAVERVVQVERGLSPEVPARTDVWVRVGDGGLEHSLGQLSRDGVSVGSVHALTEDYENTLDSLYAAADPELAWLGDSESAITWKRWASNITSCVDRITPSLSNLAQEYVSADPATPQGRFIRGATEEAMLTILRILNNTLSRLRHLADPSIASESAVRAMTAGPTGPFSGEMVDLEWDGNPGSEGPVECPPYVQSIDLPLGMRKASLVVLPDDLGRMVGWQRAVRSWVQSHEPGALRLLLEEPLPQLSGMRIGPH